MGPTTSHAESPENEVVPNRTQTPPTIKAPDLMKPETFAEVPQPEATNTMKIKITPIKIPSKGKGDLVVESYNRGAISHLRPLI